MKHSRKILNVALVISIILFLLDRNILIPLLTALWNGEIIFSDKFWTFVAILVALFGKRFNDWLNRPVIRVEFDKTSDRCFRDARPIGDRIQEFSGVVIKKRQYFRLRISNSGKMTAKKVKVVIDIRYEDMKEAERFEPNCLLWITGDQEVDLASGEINYVNLLSLVTEVERFSASQIPSNFFSIRFEIYNRLNARGIAWDRISRVYFIKIVVHGENIKASTNWFKFMPGASILHIGNLEKIDSFP